MKARRLISLLFAAIMLLTMAGCRQEREQPSATTMPAATVETTEPEQTQPTLTARQMYWKMRSALGMKYPSCYTSEITMTFRVGDGALALESEIRDRQQVIMSTSPLQLNVATQWKEITAGKETVSQEAAYYRSKDSNKAEVYMYYGEPLDRWVYGEPTDYNSSLRQAYQVTLYPVEFPEGMVLDPETQMVGEREAYVLRYVQSAEEFLGEALQETEENADEEEELKDLEIEQQLYIDKETYVLLQTKTELKDPGEQMGKMLYLVMTGVLYENEKYPLTVTSYTKVYNGLNYSEVEVPPVPQEAFDALKGFGTT